MAEHIIGLISDIQPSSNEAENPSRIVALSRRRSILDALATVLVHRESKETIAVGLRIAPDNSIILSIANNDGAIEQTTIEHARQIWRHLNHLAMGCGSHSKTSTSDPDGSSLKEIQDFKRCNYEYSFKKLMARFRKGRQPYERYESLSSVLSQVENQHSHKSLEKHLGSIIAFLSIFFRIINAHNGQFPDDEFKAFCLALEGATDAIHAIFYDEESVKRMKIIDQDMDFQLVRFLQKISSIAQSVKVLLKAVHTPWIRHHFFSGQQLVIDTVTNEEQTLDLPRTVDEYRSLAQAVLKTYGHRLPEYEGKPSEQVMQANIQSPKIRVHCECALLLHLIKEDHSQQGNHYRTLASIGCSKLACLPCWYFFQSVKNCMNLNFYVRGTNGKVHYPWKFPDVHAICAEKEQACAVQGIFADLINCRYKDLVLERQVAMPRLDSDAAMLHSEDYYMAELRKLGVL